MDDLTAVLAPLSDDMRAYNPPGREFPEANERLPSPACEALRNAAQDLHAPNRRSGRTPSQAFSGSSCWAR